MKALSLQPCSTCHSFNKPRRPLSYDFDAAQSKNRSGQYRSRAVSYWPCRTEILTGGFWHGGLMASCTFSQTKDSVACCPQRGMLCLARLQPACAVTPECSIVACVCCTPHACWPARSIQEPLCLNPCGLQTTDTSKLQVLSQGAAFSELGKLPQGCLCYGRSCASYLAGLSGDEVFMYANLGGFQISCRLSHS